MSTTGPESEHDDGEELGDDDTAVYCIMCVLYRVFLLYMPYCSLYVVYVLPIQLLGCHSCNKRLSCNQTDKEHEE